MNWCGLLNVHKPAALTSRQVVDRVQKLVYPAKVGHAGTLDPLATGVLLVCVGPATRLISRVQQGRKRYVGRFRLGQRSDTEDIEGQVVPAGDWSGVTRQQIEQLIPEFLGSILQTPPQISALKVGGQRAYKLARRGVVVELKPRPVDVFSLALMEQIDLTILPPPRPSPPRGGRKGQECGKLFCTESLLLVRRDKGRDRFITGHVVQ